MPDSMIVHAFARDFGAPTCVCRRQYFEPVDSQRCFTVILMQWPEGFRARIPCPQFLVGCSSLFRKKLPIPIMSLAKPGSKQASPVYPTAPGWQGHRDETLADHCAIEVRAKQFVLGHIAIGDGRRRWFVSAEIDLPEFAIFGGWINVWMGEGDHCWRRGNTTSHWHFVLHAEFGFSLAECETIQWLCLYVRML